MKFLCVIEFIRKVYPSTISIKTVFIGNSSCCTAPIIFPGIVLLEGYIVASGSIY